MDDTEPKDDPTPIEVDTDAQRRIEEDSEPAVAKQRKSPLADPGAPGGTAGTGGSGNEQEE